MNELADYIISELKSTLPKLQVRKRVNAPNERVRPVVVPKVEIELPRDHVRLYIELLKRGDPPIYLCECDGHLCISMHTLSKDETELVIERLRNIMNKYPPY